MTRWAAPLLRPILLALTLPLAARAPTRAASPPLAPPAPRLRVLGNRIVAPDGAPVALRGVSRSGAEYACVNASLPGDHDPPALFDGPMDDRSVRAMVAWHMTAVRVPLNEGCWLGIDGLPPAVSGPAYRAAIDAYVRRLLLFGLTPILTLHEAAPGRLPAVQQQPMPDADHSPAFWAGVARAFGQDTRIVFDLYDEPFPDDQRDSAAAWRCWRDGGMGTAASGPGPCRGVTYRDARDRDTGIAYRAASMGMLVDAVRRAGARNVLALDGVAYADSLRLWGRYAPRDSLHNLVAGWHPYSFNDCGGDPPCWDRVVAPLAARVPVLLAEMGEDDCSARYIDRLMAWADRRGLGYLAWSWNAPDHAGCRPGGGADGDIVVIASYDGTPYPGMGVGFKAHLARVALPTAGRPAFRRGAAGRARRPGYWAPARRGSFQWQLSGAIDLSYPADVYDIDLFDTGAATVAALRRRRRRAICYLSAGSYEDWRPDAKSFPRRVIGRPYQGWPGERWLDIRDLRALGPIMRARLALCKAKGFDAVEPDNVDGYQADGGTGFPLTAGDQLRYNRWLAREAHAHELSVGLKNDGDQAAELAPAFDWALTEDCMQQGWCDRERPFLAAGKAVFATEYTDATDRATFARRDCPFAARLGLSLIYKRRDLGAWRLTCPRSSTPSLTPRALMWQPAPAPTARRTRPIFVPSPRGARPAAGAYPAPGPRVSPGSWGWLHGGPRGVSGRCARRR